MAKRAFREESTGWNRSRAVDRHHDPGGGGRRPERRRLSADYSFERFDNRVLRGNSFRGSHHGAVFWAANGERLCWRGSACSLLSPHAGRNVSAHATVNSPEVEAAGLQRTTDLFLMKYTDYNCR